MTKPDTDCIIVYQQEIYMLTLKEWMELVDYKITEGSDYYSGDKVLYSLTSWNEHQDGYSFNIVFDPKEDQLVYAVEACDYKHNRAYRRKIAGYAYDSDQAWDDVNFVELEQDDDFIQKSLAIKAGEDYDTRVSIPVEFSDEELLTYMKMAHERDITFNQFIEEALREMLEEFKRDPEGVKQRAQRWKDEKGIL